MNLASLTEMFENALAQAKTDPERKVPFTEEACEDTLSILFQTIATLDRMICPRDPEHSPLER